MASLGTPAAATMLGYCDGGREPTAAQQAVVLQLAERVKALLARSGSPAALIARSGTDLSRFGARYSHAAVALADHRLAPWAVRQLYYACDEQRPRLFDQGIAGFLLGTHEPARGHVSLLLLPPEAAAPLAAAALDDGRARSLLGATYSANAYAWATTFQNCNQWVAELLALAWAPPHPPLDDLALDPFPAAEPRTQAQAWLRVAGYVPRAVRASPLLIAAGAFVPFVHTRDHPTTAVQAGVFEVSLPESLEAFARARWPAARRIELCHVGPRLVIREDGPALTDDCEPVAGDTVADLS